jgi:CHAT domain-containing protein
LEKTDFSQYAILHFATHGLLDPKNPKQLGLYLSMVNEAGQDEDGFITMQDVYNLRVPVSLVVLSACRTGLGEDVRGEGLIGLTRGFMHAGASSVVASLWKVDDEATAELMKYFYTNMLKKRMRPAAALREAQNTLRQDPQWSSHRARGNPKCGRRRIIDYVVGGNWLGLLAPPEDITVTCGYQL